MTQNTDTLGEKTCVCGHAHSAHEHYRKGSDCALCEPGACIKFALSAPSVSTPQPDIEARSSAQAPRP